MAFSYYKMGKRKQAEQLYSHSLKAASGAEDLALQFASSLNLYFIRNNRGDHELADEDDEDDEDDEEDDDEEEKDPDPEASLDLCVSVSGQLKVFLSSLLPLFTFLS